MTNATLRDELAVIAYKQILDALGGGVLFEDPNDVLMTPAEVAKQAYAYADAMLDARSK